MKLTDIEVQEFANLWLAEFGERLPLDQARVQATLLLRLYARLATPLKQSTSSPHKLTTGGDEVLPVLPQVERR